MYTFQDIDMNLYLLSWYNQHALKVFPVILVTPAYLLNENMINEQLLFNDGGGLDCNNSNSTKYSKRPRLCQHKTVIFRDSTIRTQQKGFS